MSLNIILQSEAAECGLACLAMVAGHLGAGAGADMRALRRTHAVSMRGSNLRQLMSIAARLELKARALRVELEDLDELAAPCILHWDMNHFVVLEKASHRTLTIIDPALGRRQLSPEEASRHFTGVALELTPTERFARKSHSPTRVTLRDVAGNIAGLKRAVLQILAFSLALQVFALGAPLFMQWTVDQVLVSGESGLLTVLGLGFLLALFLQLAIGLLRGWSVMILSAKFGLQWTGNVFSHLLNLPMEFFEKRHLGDVTSRMMSIQTVQRTLTTSFVEAIVDGVMSMATLAMMLMYSPRLAAVTIACVCAYLVARTVLFRRVRDQTEHLLNASALQQSHLLESIRGIQSLKVTGAEDSRRSSYFNLMNDTANSEFRLAGYSLGFGSASQAIFGIERILVIWIGAQLALQNVFSVGMLVAYLAYKDQFATRVGGLIDKAMDFRMLRLHGERIAEIMLAEPEVDPERAKIVPAALTPSIEVESLSFRYAEGEPWVVHDCSFSIAEGESVAIVGASGCGKTTLVKLLIGLLQPSSGTVRVGGHDLARISPDAYRSQLAAVMQDDQLFAGSVLENIAFGDEVFREDEVEAAARLAAVHDEIATMPMRYHSLVGDMGTVLSGGQKQRVILARALYRKPRMLFLDEATSHLDVERERLVNEAVKGLSLTKIIIAHRPETINSADRVLVMEQGRIVREFRPSKFEVPREAGETLRARLA